MSRHRTMRARCDSAMQDDDGDYGRSVEDQAFSPTTSGYLYQRDQQRNRIGNYIYNDHNDANEDFEEEEQQNLTDSEHIELLKNGLNEAEIQQLHQCVEQMLDVLGHGEHPEAVLYQAAVDSKYDANRAIQRVIDSTDNRTTSVNNNLKQDSNSGSLSAFRLQAGAELAPSAVIAPLSCVATPKPTSRQVAEKSTGIQSGLLTRASTDPHIVDTSSVLVATPVDKSAKKRNKDSTATNVEKRVLNLQIGERGGLRPDSPSRPMLRVNSSNRTNSPSVATATPRSSVVDKRPQLDASNADATATPANDRPQLNLVVVGHVDAGKSTMMGHMLHKLALVTSKELRRNEQEAKKAGKSSFSFAWVLDQNYEERKRGITMDIAQTRFATASKDVTLLDAPGHKDFIPNMIVGVAQADAAVLVVNATRGEFESGFDAGGQTREHAILVRSCGIQQLVVAINQLDKVGYDQARFDEIRKTLCAYLRSQLGYREDDLRFVPVSGFAGENLVAGPTDPQLAAWYSGPSLVEIIDSLRPSERTLTKPFRLFVIDAFKPPSGAGLCVAGTVVAGRCFVGDRLTLMPAGKPVTVKTIAKELASLPSLSGGEVQTSNASTSPLPPGLCAVDAAYAGDNVTITLSGVEPNANERSAGWILCEPSSLIRVTQRIRAQIVLLQTETLITRGMPIEAHVHSLCEPASITRLVALLNRANGSTLQQRPKVLERGQTGLVEISFERPVCVELYSDYRELGRVMLRHRGDTIASGIIVDIAKLKPAASE